MNNELYQLLKDYNDAIDQMSGYERFNWEEHFTIEFTHHSTAIEGNTISLIETGIILSDGLVPEQTTLRELDEIRSHAKAWEYVKQSVRDRLPLTEETIKDIHERIIPMPGVGGLYRTIPVYIRGAQHVPPNPVRVRDYMKDFAYHIKNRDFETPIEKAAWIHAEFTKIHPFQDGNGRTARLIMNYWLMSNQIPPTCVKKQSAKEYFSALEKYSIHGNLAPFVALIENTLTREAEEFFEVHPDVKPNRTPQR
ncbi:MAG: Fic family protein [Schwartzia sp.]|nr:Fic family protein [Schwartzia sp. (in: firmicutes)]